MTNQDYQLLRNAKELCYLKQFDKALEILNELKENNPGQIKIDYALIDLYNRSNQFPAAKELLNKKLEQAPDDLELFLRKGDLYACMNQLSESKKIYLNLYERYHDYRITWRLARLFFRLKKYSDAEEFFDMTIVKKFDNSSLYHLGFLIKKSLNKIHEAIELIDRAIFYSKNPEQYHSAKTHLLLDQKKITADEWEKSLKYSDKKEEPFLLKELAEKFLEEKNYQKSETYFLELLKLKNTPFFKSRLGYLYYKWGKYDLALEIFLEQPFQKFLIPSYINMVIRSAKESGRQEKTIEFLAGLVERHPEANSIWGAIKRLSRDIEEIP